MLVFDDTIAAISTPPGRGGIGVVRLSGTAARTILRQLSPTVDVEAIQRAQVVELQDDEGNFLDEAVVVYFQAPKSYTGQDVVEISCHGSPFVLGRLLRLCFKLGARAATPGEFTLRAFAAGRIDLTQAEAVRDLIDAQTEYQAKLASRQLKGELSRFLQPVKDELLDIIVHLESTVEFVEENLDTESIDALAVRLGQLIEGLTRLAKSYQYGRIIREGLKLAIIGRPNVGKSSLFNVLLQEERAIVTDIPGTTRDSLSEQASLGGIPIRLIDTAGIRVASDIVEQLGIARSYAAMADADLILQVIDGSQYLTEEDWQLLSECRQSHTPFAIIVNKIDLGLQLNIKELADQFGQDNIFPISAKTCQGIDQLQTGLTAMFLGREDSRNDTLILDARHFSLISESIEELNSSLNRLREGFSEEVALYHLHSALKKLGEITGETTIEDILGRIFATFCIGK
ncbi:MAG: tRNA uridine-5-carboxymethylaminomethyl(34) synthesis GTPase MnmE [Acidobacteriota bacterium]